MLHAVALMDYMLTGIGFCFVFFFFSSCSATDCLRQSPPPPLPPWELVLLCKLPPVASCQLWVKRVGSTQARVLPSTSRVLTRLHFGLLLLLLFFSFFPGMILMALPQESERLMMCFSVYFLFLGIELAVKKNNCNC